MPFATEWTTLSVAFDARELVAALADAGVDYIVIGGFAVGAHGHVRATKDLDIVPSPEFANLERLAAVLGELGATLYGTGDFDPEWVPGIRAERAYPHLRASAIETALAGYPVLVCSREDQTEEANPIPC